ncbi:uncharacterized protein Triagg1_10492 [Trichoderma aggressivum f. europaeum]|uniref:Uncharacterized protein n=1 Tax=Trichoderma aggressivum f. europaeum TaxID=173218 RepID=A0AAE1I5H7_9HYPO|nr:hypothetical protein Triagg1_10492 [Trichoderma aggressivum f. europaeum]
MSEKRRIKSLEEVEVELEYFGLTRQSAAAIVRLANNLKQTRKLRAAHIELLVPGRRLHPPSPLGQIVWNQTDGEIKIDIIGEIGESSDGHDSEPEPASRNEASSSGATTDVNATDDDGSSKGSATLDDVASSLENLWISQDSSPSAAERSTDIPPKEAEEEDPYDTPHNRDDFRWW